MNYTEEVTLFECAGDTLVGILARPETPARTGLVVIVGGPQYRAGSHRQFVLLSRSLAAAGYAVLRFDYRGMGDSAGASRDFLAVNDDIAAAINALQQSIPVARQIVLLGLCDAASAALLYCYATQDPRVNGLCLLNPWVRSEASLARTQVKHYYTRRLVQKSFWIKLLQGKMALSAWAGLFRNVHLMAANQSRPTLPNQTFQQRMGTAWCNFSGTILLLLSDDDHTAWEFLEHGQRDAGWIAALAHPRLVRQNVQDANHTFSNVASRATVEKLTLDWLESQVSRCQEEEAADVAPDLEPCADAR